MSFNLLQFREKYPVKPYDRIWHEKRTWEAISFPWPDGDGAKVNIRKLDDPTSMIEIDAAQIELVGPVVPGKNVTCSTCGARYVLSPRQDYFDATNDHDGMCEQCVVKRITGRRQQAIEINPEVGDEMQKDFEDKK